MSHGAKKSVHFADKPTILPSPQLSYEAPLASYDIYATSALGLDLGPCRESFGDNRPCLATVPLPETYTTQGGAGNGRSIQAAYYDVHSPHSSGSTTSAGRAGPYEIDAPAAYGGANYHPNTFPRHAAHTSGENAYAAAAAIATHSLLIGVSRNSDAHIVSCTLPSPKMPSPPPAASLLNSTLCNFPDMWDVRNGRMPRNFTFDHVAFQNCEKKCLLLLCTPVPGPLRPEFDYSLLVENLSEDGSRSALRESDILKAVEKMLYEPRGPAYIPHSQPHYQAAVDARACRRDAVEELDPTRYWRCLC